MFQTTIGPSSNSLGYLRPETAQGQFVNFKKLLDFNQGQMPFASASIGKSFRNEISPRSGLLRVREFLMAEIEHYVDPELKNHPRFEEVKDVKLALLDRHTQLAGKTQTRQVSVGKAVEGGMVDNQTLGYFLARIHLFLQILGVDQTKLRFRQHMANEMAHYAADCWDAELLTSYGWIECVGCADRSAYDLTVHSKRTKQALVVREARPEPLEIEEWQVEVQKKKLGPLFRKDAKAIEAAIDSLTQEQCEKLARSLKGDGSITISVSGLERVTLNKDLVDVVKRTRVENVREFTPNVIEPSFGVGRILYCLIEHVYWHRASDEARGVSKPSINLFALRSLTISSSSSSSSSSSLLQNHALNLTRSTQQVLSFTPLMAPTKVLIVPLSSDPSFDPFIKLLSRRLRLLGISHRVDNSSASIGKRYARNDELGTPFGITIDFDSVKFRTFTLRERDSTKQVRADEDEIIGAVESLVEERESWQNVAKTLPAFTGQSGDD
jgi:glycyl-tRNA synthetase